MILSPNTSRLVFPGQLECFLNLTLGESDQGGPVVTYDVDTRLTTQIGLLASGPDCGSEDVPAIYMRLDHPDILDFIQSNIKLTLKGKITIC